VTIIGNISAGGSNCISTTTGNITVNGNVIATGINVAINTTSSGLLTINGTLSASTTAPAVQSTSTSATNIINGALYNNNGIMAFYGPKLYLQSGSTQFWTFTTSNLTTSRTLYTVDMVGNVPSVSDVRSGVVYGVSSGLTGTLNMPSPLVVGYGVPTDNTVGSALLPSNIAQGLWSAFTSGLTVNNSIGQYLSNVATVQSTGEQIIAFKL
jgi:hypothetical protein